MNSEVLGARLSSAEYSLIQRIREETKTSIRYIIVRGVYALLKHEHFLDKMKKEAEEINRRLEAEIHREKTRFELRRIVMFSEQEKILKRLIHMNISSKKLAEIIDCMNEELKSVGVKFRHNPKLYLKNLKIQR